MGRRRNERIGDETRGGISKTHRRKIRKQLKDGTVDLFACLKNSTVAIEEVQDSRPASQCDVMFALSWKENPILSLEDAKYDKDSDVPNVMLDDTPDTDVDEPPPCPVDHMN